MADEGPAQTHFAELVRRDLQPLLKNAGYLKRRFTFHRRAASGSVALIQLQRSQYSTGSELRFTVNLSLWSPAAHEALGRLGWVPPVKKVPTEPACQVRQRIGFLMPKRADLWWKVTATTPHDMADVRTAIESKAMPFLESIETDEGLRDELLRRRTAGGAMVQPLLPLVMFQRLGPKEAFEEEVKKLNGELERLGAEHPRGKVLREILDRLDA
ncbi:MAG: DUF4304 domain-containing protein [Planctomycetota bacterium]|nr:DUF4304 domain-containing protein [Planctomycetota bacterium]